MALFPDYVRVFNSLECLERDFGIRFTGMGLYDLSGSTIMIVGVDEQGRIVIKGKTGVFKVYVWNCNFEDTIFGHNVPFRDGSKKSEHQQRVEEFMALAGQEVPCNSTVPDNSVRMLQARLIFEECRETIRALGFDCKITGSGLKDFDIVPTGDCDVVGVLDGCADIAVVVTGTLSSFGVGDLAVQDIVDKKNLEKFSGDGHRDSVTGKWIKPTGFVGPETALEKLWKNNI